MNVDLSVLISIGGMIASIGFAWGKITHSDKQQDRENRNLWTELTKYRTWRDEHEKDSATTRLTIEKDFSRLREIIALKDGKFDDIIQRLEKQDIKMDKLEAKIDNLAANKD